MAKNKKDNKTRLIKKWGKSGTLLSIIKMGFSVFTSCALIYFACTQYRISQRQQMFEVLERFYKEWSSSKFQGIHQRIASKGEVKNLDKDMKLICNFFERMGMYERKEIIELSEVYLMFGDDPCKYWNKLKGVIGKYREKLGEDSTYENFENLCKKIEREKLKGRL